MANLAFIFHWTPRDMDPMSLEELMGWHARAIQRHNSQDA